jgi:hypothetical protein
MEKAIGGRFALVPPSEKRPRTKDDDEKDSHMTLNRYGAPPAIDHTSAPAPRAHR